jgi:Icc-related predicted phosphoesterase
VRFRKKANGAGRVRLLFATDLHASEAVFRKFLNAVAVYEANVAILGGDLTGKRIVPIVERASERWEGEFAGRKLVASAPDERDAMLRRIRDAGQYPVQVTPEEFEELNTTNEAVDEAFRVACITQVRDWMDRAAERLAPLGVPLYVTGGNDDYLEIEKVLDEAPYVINAEGIVIDVTHEIQMISTGYGNPTPWRCPRDISEERLGERIDAMAAQLRDPQHAIFNLHVPPYGSGLDLCPRLDTSTFPPRTLVGEDAPAGSSAVRDALDRFQPMLSLHGHIHESPGVREIRHTTAVNPGSEYGEGVLHSAVVDVVESQVLSAQLLTA